MSQINNVLKDLPKVDALLKTLKAEFANVPSRLIKAGIQKSIDEVRNSIIRNETQSISQEKIIQTSRDNIKKLNQPSLRKVINGTGVVLHTNLGRARFSKKVFMQLEDVCCSNTNLEYDLELGVRGSRYEHVEKILKEITGAESVLVVNNNAASVFLILNTLAKGKEVIVSRGELVEIGGSFRIPSIMESSGCKLVEVGTTNKTHEHDYENAITENTAALLKIHSSNYKILGFTEEVTLEQMSKISKDRNIPFIYDLGSGLLADFKHLGITDEPTVLDSMKKGIDILCFSGDKLLGGPQAGIILGKKCFIEQLKKNPVLRAFRLDKINLFALEATLREYLESEMSYKNIPTLNMLNKTKSELLDKANQLLELLNKNELLSYDIVETASQTGGGTMPVHEFPSFAVSISSGKISAKDLEVFLRRNSIPIIVRIYKDEVLIDVRTLEDSDLAEIATALNSLNYS